MESATPVIETHSTKESDEDQELQAYLNSLHTAANASLGKELAPSYPLKANAYISIASNTDSRECLPLVSNEKITQTGSEDSNSK